MTPPRQASAPRAGAVLGAAMAAALGIAAARAGAAPARIAPDSLAAVRCIDRGQPDSAAAILGALASRLRGAGDLPGWARARIAASDVEPRLRQPDSMNVIAAQAAAVAATHGDTALRMRGLLLESRAWSVRGDLERALARAAALEALARRCGSAAHTGAAQAALGWLEWQRGNLPVAERQLRAALAALGRAGQDVAVARVHGFLGNVLVSAGRLDDAERELSRSLALTAAAGDVRGQLFARHDLALVELRRGDPERAARLIAANVAVLGRRGDHREQILGMGNLASMQRLLGRHEAATTTIREALALTSAHGIREHRPYLMAQQAEVLIASGNAAPAKSIWRELLTVGHAGARDTRVTAAAALASALADADSLEAADALLAHFRREPGGADYALESQVALVHADVLRRRGRVGAARHLLVRVAAEASAAGDATLGIAAHSALARAERLRGDLPAASRALARATSEWERARARVRDLEFREARGAEAQLLAQESVLAELAQGGSHAAAGAFDRLQRFRTRTLLERYSAPHLGVATATAARAAAWPGAAAMQRLLADGELLLEYCAGPDTTLVFALTRGQARVSGLPPLATWQAQLAALHDTLASAPAAGRDAATAELSRALGRLLLAPVAEPLARARRVLVAPDGELHRVPFAALLAPGAREPLGVRTPLVLVPSAAWLAALRGAPPHAPRGVLAIAGGARRGERPLAGAAREVRGLAARFADVRVLAPGRDGCTPLSPALLAEPALVHFAGHVVVNDELPWRSGLVLGAGGGGDSLLTADVIQAQSIPARLVVLSGCESASGQARTGEGLAGLTTAFLASGARAVVAAQWAVDDRITERFMARFHAGLARGGDAAGALRDARAWLRAQPGGSDPFDWSVFVLVGDPVPGALLRPRPLAHRLGGYVVAAALVALALGAFAFGRGRTGARGGRTGSEGSLPAPGPTD